jgi:hypothetical protein
MPNEPSSSHCIRLTTLRNKSARAPRNLVYLVLTRHLQGKDPTNVIAKPDKRKNNTTNVSMS